MGKTEKQNIIRDREARGRKIGERVITKKNSFLSGNMIISIYYRKKIISIYYRRLVALTSINNNIALLL